METSMSVNETLKERDGRYGAYAGQCRITQHLMSVIQASPNWRSGLLQQTQRESLHMIASKIARILNGDPDYIDSWHDIAGYATLEEQELQEKLESLI